MKTFIAAISTLVLSTAALAERESNGGYTVRCVTEDKQLLSNELRDLYEAKYLYHLSVPIDDTTAAVDQARRKIALLVTASPTKWSALQGQLEYVIKNIVFVGSATTHPDQQRVSEPENCRSDVVANYRTSTGKIEVDEHHWEEYDETNKAALLAHESIYKILRVQELWGSSWKARDIVAHLYSDLSDAEFVAWYQKRFPDAPMLGLGIQLQNPRQIAAGPGHVCALDDKGVQCWGYDLHKQLTPPPLDHPIEIATGRHHSCALDRQGVKCWGDNAFGQRKIPTLVNPKHVWAAESISCAQDDNGVRCWGDRNNKIRFMPKELMQSPLIGMGHGGACAVNNSDLVCWGGSRKETYPLKFANPQKIKVGNRGFCLKYDVGASCWDAAFGTGLHYPHASDIAVGSGRYCVVENQQTRCFETNNQLPPGELSPPTSVAPHMLSMGEEYACVIDEDKIKCWGTLTPTTY